MQYEDILIIKKKNASQIQAWASLEYSENGKIDKKNIIKPLKIYKKNKNSDRKCFEMF